MAENANPDLLGKKIFFLHPSALVQNRVIAELAQQEYEVYTAKNEAKLLALLNKHPDSVVFASINEGIKENAWDEWIRLLRTGEKTSRTDIGIIASINDDKLKSKYLEKFKVNCGFTVIKSDVDAAIKQLALTLNTVNAKGRRKYLRLLLEGETNVTVNLPIGGSYVNGVIKDISVVGFSCSFAEDPELTKNKLFSDIQIRLHSQLLKAEGIVFGSRMDGSEKIYVILFTQRVDPDMRTRIRKFIQTNMQSRIDQEIK